jgi:hypothetical protein
MHPGKILGNASGLFACTDKAGIILAPHQDSTNVSAAEHATPYAAPEDRMAKSKRVPVREDFFQAKGDERPIVIVTAGPLA